MGNSLARSKAFEGVPAPFDKRMLLNSNALKFFLVPFSALFQFLRLYFRVAVFPYTMTLYQGLEASSWPEILFVRPSLL